MTYTRDAIERGRRLRYRKGDAVRSSDVLSMNFNPVNDGPTEPDVRVRPKIVKVRVTRQKGGTKRRTLFDDVHKGRKPRATRVTITVFKSGRGVERKAMQAFLERCTECGVGESVRRTNVGMRCRRHAPKGRGAMGKLRVNGKGRWA
jgi:hypothetical protein